MSDMSIALGRRIRKLRRAKGYESMEAFAYALGVSWPTVSRYERGIAAPSMERLHQIADVLGVPIDDLLNDKQAA